MKNFTLNIISRILGKHFAMAYTNTTLFSNGYVDASLDAYRSVRRLLPVQPCGKHLGNHDGSKLKPYLATQGG